jgi:pimeloyl-ACP methyl ester carboxylesterase
LGQQVHIPDKYNWRDVERLRRASRRHRKADIKVTMLRFDLPYNNNPNATQTPDDGTISLCHWSSGDMAGKPVLHWAHANGFNAETYAPLLAPLADQFDIYGADARGHGFTQLPAAPEAMTGWDIYRDDLEVVCTALAARAGSKIWLGGHSMGGCASIMVAAKRPDLIAGLVLTDPVIVPPVGMLLFRLLTQLATKRRANNGLILAQMAAKRRANWPDAASVEAAYTGRGAFATWQDGFLSAYLRGGLKPIEDDQGNTVTLACAPKWEAANFKGPQVPSVPAIKNLRVPFTLLMAAEGSTTGAPRAFNKPRVDKKIVTVPNSTHFLPMEFPDLVRAELVARMGAA